MAEPGINLRVVLIIAVVAVYFGIWAKAETSADHPSGKHRQLKAALRVDLIRRDSPLSPIQDGRRLSNAQRLARAIERSHNRLRRFQSFIAGSASLRHSTSFYSPVNAQENEFVMQMGIGSPVPLKLNFIADTGSDLTWTQCQPCPHSCIPQTDPMYNPARSSSYRAVSCSTKFCSALSGQCDTQKHCAYFYSYGDYSYTSGNLSHETFSLAKQAGSHRWAHFRHLAFGCGHEQGGNFSDSTGIIGLGRGPLSFVSQTRSSINNTFSYCLGSIYNSSQVSPLFFGKVGSATSGKGVSVTPLTYNSFYPSFYYLTLAGISVGGKSVNIPAGTFNIQRDGTGGLFIDSGTTITYLQNAAYVPFLSAVKSSIRRKPINAAETTGLDLCYKATPALRLPAITFHFAGNAPYALPANNSFVVSHQKTGDIVCLAFASAGEEGSTSIFGNVQQQNFHITYDLQHNKLYFAQKNCASM